MDPGSSSLTIRKPAFFIFAPQKKNMKKQVIKNIFAFAVLLAVQTGCNSSEQKTDNTPTVTSAPAPRLHDTLKIYLQVQKMESEVSSLVKAGAYQAAINHYDTCLSILNKTLKENNNKGIYLFSTGITDINQAKAALYDSLHQPEKSIGSILECLKCTKLTGDHILQIKFDIVTADKLRALAAGTTGDTAKKGSLCREALRYALAGAKVIDSLKTNDMDDMRYTAFHSASKICNVMGDKTQARLYDKKYRDIYFKIYKQMPRG